MGRGARCPCFKTPGGAGSGTSIRRLYAFDFDNTILEGDSESALTRAYAKVKGRGRPGSVPYSMEFMSEVDYAQFIMDFLIESRVPLRTVIKELATLPYVHGMPRLLHKIDATTKQAPWSHFIVVSGSFDLFIRGALSTGLHPPLAPSAIIANHATPTKQQVYRFSPPPPTVKPSPSMADRLARLRKSGSPSETPPRPPPSSSGSGPATATTTIQTLHFTPYEHQTTCHLCASSLCKGSALCAYIATHGPFEQTVFVGDGANDLCPALRLKQGDLLFVRRGFALEAAIRAIEEAERGGAAYSHGHIHIGVHGHTHGHGRGSKTRSPSPSNSSSPSPSSTPKPSNPAGAARQPRSPLIKAEIVYFKTAKHIQQRLGL